MNMSKLLKIIIGLILSISLIIYLLLKIDLASVKQALLSFHTVTLLGLLLIFIVGMMFRTFRWQKLISYRENLSLWFIFKALAIGYMVNNLLPAKVGELARMEYIKRKKGIGRSFLLGTIFMERLIDMVLVLFIFTFSLLFSQPGRVVFLHNKWLFIIMTLLIALSVFFMLRPGNLIRLTSFLPEKLSNHVTKIIRSFSESIKFASNRSMLFWVSLYSLVIWAITLFSAFLILWGLNISLPFYGYFFLVAVGVLGFVIPSTSGGIGVFHAIATAALVLLGVAPDKALAYAIIAHAFDFFPNVIIGLIVTTYEGLTIKNLSSVKTTD
jgi:glycosyltransferase 2 family protein